ncbi:MAG: MotA/TolQ/ExbB proton channel family protein [Pseudanabaena sp.]|jgi:biopolymer transport protein ExbB|nr:MotA/TolQ/ExbB proton channel family protein [Pseudanabaena sp. M090S1SP2A07QC]MCA6506039.1 MotA/TolQ/ExbB proton channel family protein [Pseudanabaena sp. M172S2SP2A07QC]MCA6520094.1 MotA/TolQ/ExbB proton channel family protein [Pseudanabaena sp. M110S1SP2A07QC]MCA6524083.1 MotA/TolQ/ExbB proton channel family protein [Pseudanabaena sp. M051S1SP2A07QC]MCA6526914.1 MotA/TolQ/ExbB proton channel family protein [Pseudanabaena sp. M179S2SP2A07QC]MCA6532192.1 MotA/TolQ/ExbB proton channel famil
MSKLFDTLVAGGVTIIPLLICSFLVVALSIERSIIWSRVRKNQKRIVKTALQIYQQDPNQAEDFLQQHLDFAIARIYLEAISIPNATPTEFALALDARTQAELPNLRRFNIIFEVIVGLAPLLGLLGTVTGLITSFGSLTLGDIGGSKSLNVTGGISEALISTAMGLIVAVMALIAASIFRSLYAQQLAYFDECCTQLELKHLRSLRQQAHQQVNIHV